MDFEHTRALSVFIKAQIFIPSRFIVQLNF